MPTCSLCAGWRCEYCCDRFNDTNLEAYVQYALLVVVCILHSLHVDGVDKEHQA